MLASTTTPASSAHALQKMLQIRKKKTKTGHTRASTGGCRRVCYRIRYMYSTVLCVRWDLYDMYMYIVPVPYLSHEAVCRVGYVATLT